MIGLTAAMIKILAANIRYVREVRLSLDQAEFGDLIGVSQSQVSRWEDGAKPGAEKQLAIAEIAGVSLKDLQSRLLSEVDVISTAPDNAYASRELMLPVRLPNAKALTEMFEQVFRSLGPGVSRDELPRRLAQLLPAALGQTVARIPKNADREDHPQSHAEDAAPLPGKNPERPRPPRN